jgi:hypothetical protein
MEPRTWHILRENGTTVDITTKVQLTDAISKMGRDEVHQPEYKMIDGEMKLDGPVYMPISEGSYECLGVIADEQGVGLDEAIELVIQWGIWWRNSDGNRRCIKVTEYPGPTREYYLEEFIKAQTTDVYGNRIMPEDGGMGDEEVDALRNLEIGQSMPLGDPEAGLTVVRLPNS